jgi:hypothetical protein
MSDFGHTLDEMDVEAFFNMRDWLRKAIESKGARCTGGGVGCGQADLDFILEGQHYNVSIRPLHRDTTPKPCDSTSTEAPGQMNKPTP